MKKNSFKRKRQKKQRNAVINIFLWIWLWFLWVVLATTILAFTNSAFSEIKGFYWYWILVAILAISAILFFTLWLRNLLNVKANNIKNNQTKLAK